MPDLVADDLFSGADRVLYAPHQASGWITTKVLAPLACRHGYPLVSEAREGHDPAARLRQDRL